MNCAEYLVDFLIKHNVTDVFGYSGGYIVPFMDALNSSRNKIKVHVCYNEQGCSFAANGFARVSGKLGVYFTTSGPGAVNAFGGLADAWFDSIPIMGICGNAPSTELKGYSGVRQIGFQEMDIVSMTRSITKYSVTPNNGEEFPKIVDMAYNMALLGRKGGVIIDFPFDIQKTSVDSR
ncbi:MAG: thiamine pyrophosphate-binding protein [Peptostreptococcaceae bacterium]|nr:thiamine pyrophosphate-binding protein [Peptostreptococcaceae bacterium]